jgi:hypothetical protein
VRNFATRSARTGSDLPGWVVVALPLLALFSVLLATRSASAARVSAERTLTELRRETEEGRARIAQLSRTKAAEPAGMTSRNVLPGRVLAALQPSLPPDVRLLSTNIQYGADGIRIFLDVEARNPDAYDRFIERLASNPSFSGVLPGDETRVGPLRSRVRASWRGASR